MTRFAASLLAASLAVSILGATPDTAFTQTVERPPWPLMSHGRLTAKKEHQKSATRKKQHHERAEKKYQESTTDKQKRAQCSEQAEKLLDDVEKRAYMKKCIPNL